MQVLGIETSCDETGVAIYCSERGLRAQALYSQVAMHRDYGGVVPELASRDHVRRLLPLVDACLQQARIELRDIDAIAYTAGPGLAGALLVGASTAQALGYALGRPTLAVHHLEGHLLAPLLSSRPPAFPFVALLVSGGHTQLMQVEGLGRYALLGETIDDAAGEAFDKTAKLLGLGYPGGPELARLAEQGRPESESGIRLPRPLLRSGDLDFSFAGLKTAVLTQVRGGRAAHPQGAADLARATQDAIVDVLVAKCCAAVRQQRATRLVCAGGVAANRELRARLQRHAEQDRFDLYFPELEWCGDNGAMIALAGALRLAGGVDAVAASRAIEVRPRWPLA
jgi:N6-L-threonylcarbamoyladenine synthase